ENAVTVGVAAAEIPLDGPQHIGIIVDCENDWFRQDVTFPSRHSAREPNRQPNPFSANPASLPSEKMPSPVDARRGRSAAAGWMRQARKGLIDSQNICSSVGHVAPVSRAPPTS